MQTYEVLVKRLFLHIASGRFRMLVVGEESGKNPREHESS